MEINYLGHACFRLKGKNVTIITDPYNPEMVGLKPNKQSADLVTVSHQHGDHNFLDLVKAKGDNLLVFDAPGEYETKNVDLRAWKTFHDDQKGAARGQNTIFQIMLDGVNVVHLGDLGHVLDEKIIDELGNVDVLMIPVGGYYSLNVVTAVKVIKQIEPRIVIPMHYFMAGMNSENLGDLGGIEPFLKEMSLDVSPVEKLVVNKGDVSEGTSVVVLSI